MLSNNELVHGAVNQANQHFSTGAFEYSKSQDYSHDILKREV